MKVWTPATGMCFVTFTEHSAPVTALAFLPNSGAVVSASLDGTVRAWDLLRYRNFRTLTTPTPVQFASLAVDPAGEVVTNSLMHRPKCCKGTEQLYQRSCLPGMCGMCYLQHSAQGSVQHEQQVPVYRCR